MSEPRIAWISQIVTTKGLRRVFFIPDGHEAMLPDSDDIEDRISDAFDVDEVRWGPLMEALSWGVVTSGLHSGQRAAIKGDVQLGSRAQFQKTGRPPIVYEVYKIPRFGLPRLRPVEE